MTHKLSLLSAALGTMVLSTAAFGQAPAAAPADGITMEMMPITAEQIKACRDQASSQLASEQDTLHKREHGQDNDKMKQGAVTGITGLATSAVSRRNNGYWWGGNNNGAQTAAATGATQRTNRNSADVASTTATSQTVGVDAYSQCVSGIKGPEYVHYRQTGKIEAFTGSAPAGTAAAPPPAPKPMVVEEGDGKHFILTAPGTTDPHEVVLQTGSKNVYIEEDTGDKYIVMPDGTVTHLAKHKATS